MIAIVESRADRASVHVCDQLRRLAAWDERVDDARPDADGGGTYYRTDGFELRSFDALHLDLVRPDEAFGESPDLLVFASRHSGETGPLLSAHFTGNVGPAEFGGEANAVATAAPNALVTLLEAYDRYAPDAYEVGMECTHHGPTDVGCPSLFAELGSDDAQWDDPAGAEAVARAILDLRGVSPHRIDPVSERPRQLVGFGGGHYVPRFERIVRETAWTVGHVAADWGLDALDEIASESGGGGRDVESGPDGRSIESGSDGPASKSDLFRALFEASTATHAVVEGTRPELVQTIDELGYRVVSEAWVREVDDRPLSLVEAVESTLGPVADGVQFGDRRTESFDVVSLAADLVSTAEGIDPERTWDVVTAKSVAVETANGGSRLGDRIAVPSAAESGRTTTGVPLPIVEGLADVVRTGADAVTVTGEAIVVEETTFDPDRARELGVPDGPAFGKLAEGTSVTVDGTVVDPEDVHETGTTRYPI